MLECKDLIPSYLTEIFFCLFVIFHVFVEGKTNDAEKVRSASLQSPRNIAQNENHQQCLSEGLTGVSNSMHHSLCQQHHVLLGMNQTDTSIPVYIVKDADCLGHNQDLPGQKETIHLSHDTPNTIFRYTTSEDTSKQVLLV